MRPLTRSVVLWMLCCKNVVQGCITRVTVLTPPDRLTWPHVLNKNVVNYLSSTVTVNLCPEGECVLLIRAQMIFLGLNYHVFHLAVPKSACNTNKKYVWSTNRFVKPKSDLQIDANYSCLNSWGILYQIRTGGWPTWGQCGCYYLLWTRSRTLPEVAAENILWAGIPHSRLLSPRSVLCCPFLERLLKLGDLCW